MINQRQEVTSHSSEASQSEQSVVSRKGEKGQDEDKILRAKTEKKSSQGIPASSFLVAVTSLVSSCNEERMRG